MFGRASIAQVGIQFDLGTPYPPEMSKHTMLLREEIGNLGMDRARRSN
jgi:hypothetical protein